MNLVRYCYLRFRYPALREYLDMGNGIEARAARVASYWRPHLELTRGFQRDALRRAGDVQSIAVLGAGRLLDVDIEALVRSSKSITLVDADPAARGIWRRERRRRPRTSWRMELREMTGMLAPWKAAVSEVLRERDVDINALIDRLVTLEAPVENHFDPDAEFVVSLNLLSQIPIYWREWLSARIVATWGAEAEQAAYRDSYLEPAIRGSMDRLQHQHIEALRRSKANTIVLVFDRVFYYYLPDRAEWQEETAVPGGMIPRFLGWRVEARDSWLWHLAPYGIEDPDCGSIHEVVALELRRDESATLPVSPDAPRRAV